MTEGLASLVDNKEDEKDNKDDKRFDELIKHLPDRDCSFDQADYYAIQFLKASDAIIAKLRIIRNNKIEAKHNRGISETLAFKNSPASKIGEKDKDVMVDEEYLKADTIYQDNKHTEQYYEKLLDLFISAHHYYKGLARDK